MRHKLVLGLTLIAFVFCSLSAIWSQETQRSAIRGRGTANALPKFTGTHTIGNTAIYEQNGCVSEQVNFDTTVAGIFCLHDLGGGATVQVATNLADRVAFIAENDSETGNPVGVEGFIASREGGFGVIGVSANTDGAGYGVLGQTASPQGVGVVGDGVRVGVYGVTNATTGYTEPISGLSFSPDGSAAVFRNRAGGNLIVGQGVNDADKFRVDGNGTVFATGGFQAGGADFAEYMAVAGQTNTYHPGDLLMIDVSSERRLRLADTPYSTLVAGIYSTKPGVAASPHSMDDPALKKEVPMAVVGIVPCKVSSENGPIQIGDLLVTSRTLGHAMKGTDRGKMLGAVIGKALEPLQRGTGLIAVLVTLQ